MCTALSIFGSTDDWNTHGVLIADEPSDIEGDGNYFKIIFETGEPGEFLIKGGEVKSAVTPDGSFQGVSYKEIYEAINEAIRNDKDDNQPTVPSNCGLADVGPGLHGANFKPPGAKA